MKRQAVEIQIKGMESMHYLDHSATTFVLPEAAKRAYTVMTEQFGNPSSVHTLGLEAEKILRESRKTVAQALGAAEREIYFTGGGSESINTAVRGLAEKYGKRRRHIISSEIEHAATLNTMKRLESQDYEVTLLKPDAAGNISMADFRAAYREDETVLVSLMLVNNETGALLPLAEIGAFLKRKPDTFFHIDGVQGFFRTPLRPAKLGADAMSLSGHKIGAPKGIGILYLRDGVRIPPLIYGGGQERGMRGGTEALPNIAALAEAVRYHQENWETERKTVEKLRAYLEEEITKRFPFAQFNGVSGVPHVLNVSLPGCKSEVMLRVLQDREVYVSAGSACAKGKQSHVLAAMGLSAQRIDSALRISMAASNTKEDIDALLDGLEEGVQRLKR
jgi:cysteine desulfurase